MYTREKIEAMSTTELSKLLGSVNYDRLGGADGKFYVMLNPFKLYAQDKTDFEPIFAEVPQEVVVEYLVRLLTEDEIDPSFNVI